MSLLPSLLQEAVINELKCKTRLVQEKKLLQQDEVYNGALEDILLGLKSEPYRRADAVRRSQRRRIDSNRLSRTMEELEFWVIVGDHGRDRYRQHVHGSVM